MGKWNSLLGLLLAGFMFPPPVGAEQVAPVSNGPDPRDGLDLTLGQKLPVPPRQNQPWTPPNDSVAKAAAQLFDLGLADPRGCEYREFAVPVSNNLSKGGAAHLQHGWVIPGSNGGKMFAVAWDGLVYPVEKVYGPASLSEDIDLILGPGAKMLLPEVVEPGAEPYYWHKLTYVAPLWRLGMNREAKKVAEWARIGDEPPLKVLSEEWLSTMMRRALCAHMRGYNGLAAADAEKLTQIYPQIEPALWAMVPEGRARSKLSGTYYDFLKPLPALLDDSRRRLKAASSPEPAATGLQAEIADLENVSVPQRIDAGLPLGLDPRIQALVRRGDEAVEPLLEVIAHDHRLTRAVTYHQAIDNYWRPIPVATAADVAFGEILGTSTSVWDDDESRQAHAERIRIQWEKLKPLSRPERCLALLADDAAGPECWARNAQSIVRQAGEGEWIGVVRMREPSKISPPTAVWWETAPSSAGNRDWNAAAVRESLLKHAGLSVSELMALRSDEARTYRDLSGYGSFSYAVNLALALARWDPEAAKPVLARRMRDVAERPEVTTEAWAPELKDKLLKMEVAGGWPMLACWAKYADFEGHPADQSIVDVLVKGRDRPEVIEALDYMFNDPHGGWHDYISRKVFWNLDEFERSPLVETKPFLKLAAGGLANRSVAGSIATLGNLPNLPGGMWHRSMGLNSDYVSEEGISDRGPFHKLSSVDGRDFRVCDYFAWLMAGHGGPKCGLSWNRAKQDEAVATCREWVKKAMLAAGTPSASGVFRGPDEENSLPTG